MTHISEIVERVVPQPLPPEKYRPLIEAAVGELRRVHRLPGNQQLDAALELLALLQPLRKFSAAVNILCTCAPMVSARRARPLMRDLKFRSPVAQFRIAALPAGKKYGADRMPWWQLRDGQFCGVELSADTSAERSRAAALVHLAAPGAARCELINIVGGKI